MIGCSDSSSDRPFVPRSGPLPEHFCTDHSSYNRSNRRGPTTVCRGCGSTACRRHLRGDHISNRNVADRGLVDRFERLAIPDAGYFAGCSKLADGESCGPMRSAEAEQADHSPIADAAICDPMPAAASVNAGRFRPADAGRSSRSSVVGGVSSGPTSVAAFVIDDHYPTAGDEHSNRSSSVAALIRGQNAVAAGFAVEHAASATPVAAAIAGRPAVGEHSFRSCSAAVEPAASADAAFRDPVAVVRRQTVGADPEPAVERLVSEAAGPGSLVSAFEPAGRDPLAAGAAPAVDPLLACLLHGSRRRFLGRGLDRRDRRQRRRRLARRKPMRRWQPF